jgi:hypothetical protein
LQEIIMYKTPQHSITTSLDREGEIQPTRSANQPPMKSFQLSSAQAARWLDQLGKNTAAAGQNSGCLEQLRDSLEDSAWLACWKREYVIVELCPSMLASVLEALLQISQTDQAVEDAQVLEEIIQILSTSN